MNMLEKFVYRIRDRINTLDEPQASILIVALAKVLVAIDQPTPVTSPHELLQRLCAPDVHAAEQRAYKRGYQRGYVARRNATTRQR